MDEFDIYIRSFRAGGPERPELALRRVFGLDEEQAREFVASLPRVVKRRVPAPDRGRYATVLGEMGAELEFRRSPIQPIQAVAVKGVGAGQGGGPQARQPGNILTLGDLLAEPGPAAAAARPAPVWPAPVTQGPPATPVDVEAASPAASVQPAAVSLQDYEAARISSELSMAHTHRVEAAGLPLLPGDEPDQAMTPGAPPGVRRAWTVANTPAVGESTGEAFAANPVKGPATPTLRQHPAFGAATAGPAAAPAEPVPEAAPPAAKAERPATRREVVEVRHANPAVASAEAASLASGWQDPAPAAAPARPARPLASAKAPIDAAHAYSQASTSDSMKLDPLEPQPTKQPSWLVQESSLRQQVAGASPLASAFDALELSDPSAAGGMAGEAYDGESGGRWLSALAGGDAPARGRARPATSMRASPQAATSNRASPQAATSMRAAPQHQMSQRAQPAGSGPIPIANLPSGPPGARLDTAFATRSAGTPARPAGVPARPQRRTLSRALGVQGGSLPLGVRLLLRVGLGVSAFLLLLTLRACPLLKTDLDRELAQFEPGEAPGDEPAAAGTELAQMRSEAAHDWIEAGNHQFRDPSSGEVLVDKDPVRGLVNRLNRLGAREVYVYGVQTVDLIVYAEGIDVVLPDDESQRGAIFLEESRFHRLDAPSEPDTGQPRLRIRVP